MANLQPFIKFALLFSVLGVAAKIVLWQQGLLENNPQYSGMSYLLCLMLSSFFSLIAIRKSSTAVTTFIKDFKYGMKSVAFFSLVVCFFTYGFYEYIDPEYFPNRIATVVDAAEAVDISTVKSPMNLTKKQVIANQTRNAEFLYNSLNHSFISLFVFLLLGAIYSSLITLLVRKVF